MLLTATLATALAVGVAGGATAATAHKPDPAAAERHTAAADKRSVPAARHTAAAAAERQTGAAAEKHETDAAGVPGEVIAAPRAVFRLAAEPARKKSRSARKARPAATTGRPAAWVNPNPAAVVSSCFGQRWGRLHAGVDMAGPNGSPIVAAGAGVVISAGAAGGYGNAVLIDHGNGYLTHYGHLSAITVQVGQQVAAGQQIGDEGSTGHSTGPHLHFEVHQGFYQNPIEPTRWMHEHGVDITGCPTF